LFVILGGGGGGGVELAIPGSAVECFTTEPNPLGTELGGFCLATHSGFAHSASGHSDS